MHFETKHDTNNRRTEFHGAVSDMELTRARGDENDIVRAVRYGIADRVADRVMERLAPAIDGVLNPAEIEITPGKLITSRASLESVRRLILEDPDNGQPLFICSELKTDGKSSVFETLNPETNRRYEVTVTVREKL